MPPSPPYIQITGCEDRVYPCLFKEKNTNLVTCAVYGAHPNVSLGWGARNGKDISFSNFEKNVTERGKTFNISVSANFKVSEDILCDKDISIECHFGGPFVKIMKAEAQALIVPSELDLSFLFLFVVLRVCFNGHFGLREGRVCCTVKM